MTAGGAGDTTERRELVAGSAYAIAAYGVWGIVPIYWKWLERVDALEILAHRVAWSVVFLAIVLTALRRWALVGAVIGSWKSVRVLLITTVLISANWGLFIWAVDEGHLLEASLGYFINPLVNVALGMAFLRERLDRAQLGAVSLAGVGVLWLTVSLGVPPWVALTLAFTFGAYGLLRKTAPAGPLVGLFVETLLCAPIAIGYLALRASAAEGALGRHGAVFDVLLVSTGVVTALPLLWFTSAARRLPLSTLGLFQYVAPTLQFLIAVLVFGEAFSAAHAVAFGCIWTALAIYTARMRAISVRAGSDPSRRPARP